MLQHQVDRVFPAVITTCLSDITRCNVHIGAAGVTTTACVQTFIHHETLCEQLHMFGLRNDKQSMSFVNTDNKFS